MPRGAAMSLLFLCRLGQTTALCSTGGGAPGQQACCLGGSQTRSRAAAVATGQVRGVLDGQTCGAAGFDDADTGTAARTVSEAEVRRRPAAIGGAGCVI
jgi:hypothetical protein